MIAAFIRRRKFDPMDHPRIFRLITNSWPPYLGAGIDVEDISRDWRTIRVVMKLRWYNRNYVNSHFGGNLFSMTDPFYMLMLIRNLGRDYIVWDTAAKINYLQPGRGKVSANFTLDEKRLDEIRTKAASGEKLLERFRVDVLDEEGARVAAVTKTLYIRKKRAPEQKLTESDDELQREGEMDNLIDASPRILSSGWGKMHVEKIGNGKDFKLWPGGGRPWDWSENGTDHSKGIQQGDIQELITKGCQVVILTTGRFKRLKVPQNTVDTLKAQSIEVIVADTKKAIQLYNDYAVKGMAVGGLFHSTC